MIIGFLGKGGSGKSTLATTMVKHLLSKGNKVLAVDADHNVDLLFNLGVESEIPYLGDAMDDIRRHAGLEGNRRFMNFFLDADKAEFKITPPDEFTAKYATQVGDQLLVMASGPHTDKILYGENCSHELSSTLRLYLPMLQLGEDEWVLVDEKAGRDGAGTGIPTGYHYTVIVVDPTAHGAKAAAQIAELLEFFGCEYDFAVNKVSLKTNMDDVQAFLPKQIKFQFSMWAEQDFAQIPESLSTELDKVVTAAKSVVSQKGDNRYKLTVKKFEDRKQYADDMA